MELPETAALRTLAQRYVAGEEPLETAAPLFALLLIAYFEANYQARLRGESPQIEFTPADLTPEERRRFRALATAASETLDSEALPALKIEWLPVEPDTSD